MQRTRRSVPVFLAVIIIFSVFIRFDSEGLRLTGSFDESIFGSVRTSNHVVGKSFISNRDVLDRAWIVLEQYLESARENDLRRLSELSHQMSEVCRNPETRDECNNRMTLVYELGRELDREDFKNIWSDSKQIIISTDYKRVREDEPVPIMGLVRSTIYFTRDKVGTPKVLGFRVEDGAYLMVGDGEESVYWRRLEELVREIEKETLRDSNNNGWWDGIEELFY